MSKTLNEILAEGQTKQMQMVEETKGLVAKWEPSGLLDGFEGKDETVHKTNMAIILENQARQLVTEATRTGTATNSEQWSGVALPLVRRVFGEIAAKEFVSIQPMNLPSGLVFYIDFKYTSGQPGSPAYSGSSLFGSDGGSGKLGSTQVAEGGLYGPGRFGYTINDVSQSGLTGTTASVSWVDVDFTSELSAAVAAGTLTRLTIDIGSADSNFDPEGVRAFTVSGSLFGTTYLPQYTKVSGDNITWVVSSSNPGQASLVVEYHRAPTDNTRGDFEDKTPDGTTSIGIPEIELEVKSEPIVAKTRKLKAIWTPEMAQDLNAYHSIDAEAQLTAMLSEYVSLEIDLEILEMLQVNALSTNKEYWSAKPGMEFDTNTNTFISDSNVNAASAYTKNTWFQTLANKIQKVSNKIHQLTMRGGANFIVLSPSVATILESIPGFTVNTSGDKAQFAGGVTMVGTFAQRFKVYKNPYMTENRILVGFKGSSFLETGAVYAPYVPLILTPLVYDPQNFTPRRGVMTRYAKKMIRPEFYGEVVIGDLNFV